MLTSMLANVTPAAGLLAKHASRISNGRQLSNQNMHDGKAIKLFNKDEWSPSGAPRTETRMKCEDVYPKLKTHPKDLDGIDAANNNEKALNLNEGLEADKLGIPAIEYHGDVRMPHPLWTKADCDGVQISHLKPQGFAPRLAYSIVWLLRRAFDIGTGYSLGFKNDSCMMRRITILETVAGIPGMVGGMLRHFRSLRRLSLDYGWIHTLLEEAENERMHLMICMSIYNPHPLVRAIVYCGQAFLLPFYTIGYMISHKFCHSFVGYLEEEAVKTYTQILDLIDHGKLPKFECLAPEPARKYYHLPEGATMRDIITNIRADEAHHRELNHCLAWMGPKEVNPFGPGY